MKDFWANLHTYINKYGQHQRMGQMMWNVLEELRPDLASRIRGSYKYDPFNNDANINDFLDFIERTWEA